MTEEGAQAISIAIQEAALTVTQTRFTAINDHQRDVQVDAAISIMTERIQQARQNDLPPPPPVPQLVPPAGPSGPPSDYPTMAPDGTPLPPPSGDAGPPGPPED